MTRWLSIAFVLLAGCAADLTPPPERTTIVWSKNIAYAAPRWRVGAERWFRDPIVLVCHGGNIGENWFLYPDGRKPMLVDTVARTLVAAHPGRPVVLIVCNESGVRLDVPGVFYATKNVQGWPARQNPPPFFDLKEDVARGIEDFRTN